MALAKTSRPTLRRTVLRTRLFRRLDRTRATPVTWVCGAPGAGKTALVSSYLAARKLRTVWYQLDAGDSDVATFFFYLGRAAPRRRRSLPLLTQEYRQSLPVFSRRFFRAMYERLKPPFALVFDNYQELPPENRLHGILAHAIDELPRGGRLIVISRADPPAALARHRAHQHIEVIDDDELRFTRAEGSKLVRSLAPGRWPRQTLHALQLAAHGWGAGLVLLATQFAAARPASPVAFNADVLFDYFAGEVFRKTDRRTRDVLLHTAFLPRVTRSGAEALMQRRGAGNVLVDLHRLNYFTTKRKGSGEPVYEYHPLFRTFLLSQANQRLSGPRLDGVRRRAGQVAEVSGLIDEAALLFRDAGDWSALAVLVNRHAGIFIGQGRAQTVERWTTDLPDSVLNEHPSLLLWRGLCQLGSQHAASQADLKRALTVFQKRRDATGIIWAASALIHAYVGSGNVEPVDFYARLLIELVGPDRQYPSEEAEMRVSVALMSAIAYGQARYEDAAYWAQRSLDLTRTHPDLGTRAITAYTWFCHCMQSDVPAVADPVVNEMRDLMRAQNSSPAVAAAAAMTVVFHEWLTARTSYRQTVGDVLERADHSGMLHGAKDVVVAGGIFGALSDGDLQTAEAWLREMEKDIDSFGPGYHSWYQMLSLRAAVVRGNLDQAEVHRVRMMQFARPTHVTWPFNDAVSLLLSAGVRYARGQRAEGWADLHTAAQIGQELSSPYVEFMARLAEASFHLEEGQETATVRALRQGLAIGRARGLLNTHTWDPSTMARLCAAALYHDIETDYVRTLIRRRGLAALGPAHAVVAWPWPIKVLTLGRFRLLRDEEPLTFVGKVQRRPLQLLKAVIALGQGEPVREGRLIDALWPDAAGDAGKFALTTTIHRLRRLIGEHTVLRQDNEVNLDDRHCWVDLIAVHKQLDDAEATPVADASGIPKFIDRTWRAVQLYVGPFLGDEAGEPWVGQVNDKLQRRLLKQIGRVVTIKEEASAWAEAAEWCEEGLRIQPCSEEMCRKLMTCYDHLGRRADVDAAYRRCQEALAAQLGTAPSAQTELLRARLQGH